MPWGDGKVSMRVLNRMPWLKLVQQPPGLLLGPGEVHLGPNLLRQPQHQSPPVDLPKDTVGSRSTTRARDSNWWIILNGACLRP